MAATIPRRAPLFRTVSHISTNSDNSSHYEARSRSRPASLRVSMEDYYHSQEAPPPTLDIHIPGDPPSYDAAINGAHLPATRLKIQPREDEGREQLPPYTCSIMIRAVLSKKMELETAVHRAFDRNWHRVFVELQGTALRLYKAKSAGLFADGGGPLTSADMPPYLKAGELLKIYSLQHADVGIAADYDKRPYVIRVRVETDQFLLSCVEIETYLLWVESLTAAIDLAPPLDERKLPRDNSMPFRNRRPRPPPPAAPETIPEEESEGRVEPVRTGTGGSDSVALRDMLRLGPGEGPGRGGDSGAGTRGSERTAPPPAPSTSATTVAHPPRPLFPLRLRPPPPPRPPQAQNSASIPSTSPPPTLTPAGKWAWHPTHNWSPRHDLLYAKRCLAPLRLNTPRKSNLVICRGTRWVVNWATGELTRWEPPLIKGGLWGEEGPPRYTELVGPWGVFGVQGGAPRI